MNQPTIEQFEELQHTVHELSSKLEQLDLMEKKQDFTIRDSAVKIGIAEGLASNTHFGISKLEHEMVQLRAEMKELRESNEQQIDVLRQQMNQQSTLLKDVASAQQRQEQLLQAIFDRLPPKQ
jgi:hypothetical protein